MLIDRTKKGSDTGQQKKSNKVYTNPETSRKKNCTVGDSIIRDIIGVWISKNQQARFYINS